MKAVRKGGSESQVYKFRANDKVRRSKAQFELLVERGGGSGTAICAGEDARRTQGGRKEDVRRRHKGDQGERIN